MRSNWLFEPNTFRSAKVPKPMAELSVWLLPQRLNAKSSSAGSTSSPFANWRKIWKQPCPLVPDVFSVSFQSNTPDQYSRLEPVAFFAVPL